MQKPPKQPFVSDLVRRVASPDPTRKTWTCPRCGVIPAKELHHAPGYYIRQPCACEERHRAQPAEEDWQTALRKQQRERIYTWLGWEWADLALMSKTFETFEQERQPEAFETARAFAKRPQGTLVLFGSYGVGKTHLLAAIANEFGSSEKPCLYVSAITLFETIQERIQQNREYHDLLKRAIHTPLLLIDDLDKVKPSEFRESIYYLLIDKRRLAERPLALSCNVSPSALERWIGKAACSRLMMGLCPVKMEGLDYRTQGRQKSE
jgi:DNA replication protein DnaC